MVQFLGVSLSSVYFHGVHIFGVEIFLFGQYLLYVETIMHIKILVLV